MREEMKTWIEAQEQESVRKFLNLWPTPEESLEVAYQVMGAAEESENELLWFYAQLELKGEYSPEAILGGFIAYVGFGDDSPLLQCHMWEEASYVLDTMLQGNSREFMAGYIAGRECRNAPGMGIVGKIIYEWFHCVGEEGTPDYFVY